jgi:NAD(P)H-dependent FMN reductase
VRPAVAGTADVARLDGLPHFDDVPCAPSAVVAWRDRLARADAIVIATPEYAHGMPGTLKNALDWIVGSGELYGRAAVIISAAPTEGRGAGARRWTEETLRMQGADVRASFSVALPRDGAPEALEAGVAAVVDALAAAARSSVA